MNTFFLSLHSGLMGLIIAVLGFTSGNIEFPIVGAAASVIGLLLILNWLDLLKSYRQLNGAKYQVVHQMEKLLDFAPYDVEWDFLGRGKDKQRYLKLTVAEGRVPFTIGFAYLILLVLSIGIAIREIG